MENKTKTNAGSIAQSNGHSKYKYNIYGNNLKLEREAVCLRDSKADQAFNVHLIEIPVGPKTLSKAKARRIFLKKFKKEFSFNYSLA